MKSWQINGVMLMAQWKYFHIFWCPISYDEKWSLINDKRSDDVSITHERVKEMFPLDTPQIGAWYRFGLLYALAVYFGIMVIAYFIGSNLPASSLGDKTQVWSTYNAVEEGFEFETPALVVKTVGPPVVDDPKGTISYYQYMSKVKDDLAYSINSFAVSEDTPIDFETFLNARVREIDIAKVVSIERTKFHDYEAAKYILSISTGSLAYQTKGVIFRTDKGRLMYAEVVGQFDESLLANYDRFIESIAFSK